MTRYKRTPDAIGLIHREVAAVSLGRELLPTEVVHHVDENKLNNHPSNLWVFQSTADHTRFHAGGTLIDHGDGTFSCASKNPSSHVCECGNSKSLSGKRCVQCAMRSRISNKKPTRSVLQRLVWEKPSMDIAKDYGVSDRTIVNWCRSYNIPKPPRGYWTKQRAGARAD